VFSGQQQQTTVDSIKQNVLYFILTLYCPRTYFIHLTLCEMSGRTCNSVPRIYSACLPLNMLCIFQSTMQNISFTYPKARSDKVQLVFFQQNAKKCAVVVVPWCIKAFLNKNIIVFNCLIISDRTFILIMRYLTLVFLVIILAFNTTCMLQCCTFRVFTCPGLTLLCKDADRNEGCLLRLVLSEVP